MAAGPPALRADLPPANTPPLAGSELIGRRVGEVQDESKARTDQSLEAWREGPHDDLVLAVALAAWVGQQGVQQLWVL